MTCLNRSNLYRPIVIYVILSFSLVATLPAKSFAIFVSSEMSQDISSSSDSLRDNELVKIQKVLESKVIEQRLTDLGLNPGEIKERVKQLSDDEIHYFATQLDSLNAGAGVGGVVISLLVVVILVLVILQLTGHKIIVE